MEENKILKNTRVIHEYVDRMLLKDIEAKKMLIEYYVDVALDILEKENIEMEKDDLLQTAYLIVINGVNNYKKEYCVFSTYIANHIKYYANKKVLLEKKNITEIPIGLDVQMEKENNDFSIDLENNELLTNAIKKLDKRNKEIIYLYFYQKETLDSISDKYNISKTRTAQLIQISLNKIKGELLYYKTLDELKLKNDRLNFYNFILVYFQKYSKEEIDNAIDSLSAYTKTKFKEINITNDYNPKLYKLLKKIESILSKEKINTNLKLKKTLK